MKYAILGALVFIIGWMVLGAIVKNDEPTPVGLENPEISFEAETETGATATGETIEPGELQTLPGELIDEQEIVSLEVELPPANTIIKTQSGSFVKIRDQYVFVANEMGFEAFMLLSFMALDNPSVDQVIRAFGTHFSNQLAPLELMLYE